MAELLAHWLNEEVGLSKRVTNFEEDFASGYLFGELLYKFNQQADFEEFSTKNATSHYVMNFERLEPTLRALKIQFNSKTVEQVMRGERGLALRLLYQVKMVLEKVYPPADISIVAKTGKFGDNLPAQKIVASKPCYDGLTHDFFKQRLAKLNRAQKEIDLENHLRGFELEKDRQAQQAARADAEDHDADVQHKQEVRRIQINKLQRNAGFMEEWMQKGAEQWKLNMSKKREREAAQLDFDLSQAEKYNDAAQTKLNEANTEVHDGIDRFEETLASKGIATKVDKDHAAAAVAASLAEDAPMLLSATVTATGRMDGSVTKFATMTHRGNFTLTSTGLKSRAKKIQTEDEAKQRIKRRRRLITQQEHLFSQLHATSREQIVREQARRQSRQEKELDYEAWRTTQCKAIIVENRKLREQQYAKRRDLDTDIAQRKEECLIEEMCAGSQRSVSEALRRTGELKTYEQEQKKKQRTELCAGLMDSIFDIADEAFNHRQSLDARECDQRNWDNWITLFVHDKPIAGTLSELIAPHQPEQPASRTETSNASDRAKSPATGVDEENAEKGGEKGQEAISTAPSEANCQLNETELDNYLRNCGEWPLTLVTNSKINLMDVVNPPVEASVVGAKGAPKKAAPSGNELMLDEADLKLADEAENNFLLGDVIDQLIKLNFEERAKTKHPQTPNWLSLKLAIMGYPFSGTRTISRFIKQRFGLDVFHMDELVQEAIDCPAEPQACADKSTESIPEVKPEQEQETSAVALQVENTAAADDTVSKGTAGEAGAVKSQKSVSPVPDDKSVVDGLVAEEELISDGAESLSEDEEMSAPVREELRQCGLLVRECLLEGREIPDMLYVRLFVNKLRASYEYKTPLEKREDVRAEADRLLTVNLRLAEIEQQLACVDIKERQQKRLLTEQSDLQAEGRTMQSLAARGWILVEFPCNYAQAKLLEEALSGYKPQEELEPTKREIETQAAASLVRPNPKEEPPVTLIPSGLDAVLWLDCPIAECLRRADGRRFDSDAPEDRYHVEDARPPATQAPLCERLLPLSEDDNCVNTVADRAVAFDQTTNSLQKWFKQFGDENTGRSLLQIVQANGSVPDVQGAVDCVLTHVLTQKATKRNELRDVLVERLEMRRAEEVAAMEAASPMDPKKSVSQMSQPSGENVLVGDHQTISKGSKLDARTSPAASKGKLPNASQEKIMTSIESVKGSMIFPGGSPAAASTAGPIVFERDNIDGDFRPVLIRLWQETSENYRCQMKGIFQGVRHHRERAFHLQAQMQQRFLTFLHRRDTKQECLDAFVLQFNAFSDEYPDLREDDQTKEELHQRTDVLSDELWEIVEDRREQNVEERRRVMEAGETEFGLEFLTLTAQQLMQAELDKFKVSVQLIHDYYHAVEERNTPELPAIPSVELAFDGDDLPPVEAVDEKADHAAIESYSYPRLEKLLQLALRQQVVPDLSSTAANGGGKDDKKGKAAKGKPVAATDAVADGAGAEDSLYAREMKEALRVEKSILRFRLVQVRNWTQQRLQELRRATIRVHKKLEDWIAVAARTELDAIEEMCSVIKRAIEAETKIQSELSLRFMDFTVDEGTLNFITPEPPKLDALEEYRSDRFAIPQLNTLLGELEMLTQASGSPRMQVVELASLIFSKIKLSLQTQSFEQGMPHEWNKLALSDVVGLLRALDPANSGFVDWRTLFTYMALEQSPVPEKLDTTGLSQENGFAEREAFVAHSWWYSEGECSRDRQRAHPFARVKMLSELLFEANKTTVEGGREVLCLSEFERRVTAGHKPGRSFHDLLFCKHH